jgi:alginate O-acetyltransferase complex protein AlgI
MLLHTPQYLGFLLLFGILYWVLPGWQVRKLLLLVGSYLFYNLFDQRFALVLALLTLVNYLLGFWLASAKKPKLVYFTGLAFNLGILAYFKYVNFFLDSVYQLFSGSQLVSPALNILLPVGISFYTFQAISYITEVQRGKLHPCRSLLDFSIYLSFFPKLIAGPFVRPAQFLGQLETKSELRSVDWNGGLGLLLTGLFKKVVIADHLAVLADVAYRSLDVSTGTRLFPTPLYIQGFYLYAILIYADFSGYTDLARGSAQLLGFQLPANFNRPYFASTLTQFWDRWHMSLTQWFREYMFFPLSRWLLQRSQRRHPQLVRAASTLITMTLIGLWHGAAWTFVLWGLWHGVFLVIERLARFNPQKCWQKVVSGLVAFHLVGLGWVLFRAPSFTEALVFMHGLLAGGQIDWAGIMLWPVLLAGILLLAVELIPGMLKSKGAWLQVLVVTTVLLVLMLYALDAVHGGQGLPFIYGQF